MKSFNELMSIRPFLLSVQSTENRRSLATLRQELKSEHNDANTEKAPSAGVNDARSVVVVVADAGQRDVSVDRECRCRSDVLSCL